MSSESRDFSALLNTKCERKMKRKVAKKIKANCRNAYSQHLNVESTISKQLEDSKRKKKLEKRRRLRNKKRKEKNEAERKKRIEGKNYENFNETDEEEGEDECTTIEQFREEADKVRHQRLKEDLDDDDKEIRRLERLIRKSKKRKKGKIEVEEMSEDELEKFFKENDLSEEED